MVQNSEIFNAERTVLDEFTMERMVNYQEDQLIAALTPVYNEIRERVLDGRGKSNKLMADPTTRKLYDKLDEIVLERTGIKIRHTSSITMVYGVYVPPDKHDTFLAEQSSKTYKYVQNTARTCADGKCGKTSDVEGSNTDLEIKKMLTSTLKVSQDIDRKIDSKKVIIDLANGTIKGLDNNDPVYLITDPFKIFRILEFSGEEAASTLVHEVGHVFTHISTKYNSLKHNQVLTETLLSYVKHLDDSDGGKAYILEKSGYSKNDDGDEVYDKHFEKVRAIDSNIIGFATNSEQMADQFVVRHGGGASLASALLKLHEHDSDWANRTGLFSTLLVSFIHKKIVMSLFVAFIPLMVASGTITAILPILMGSLMGRLIVDVFYQIGKVLSTLKGGSASNETTYDDIYNRLRRIKRDQIQVIRDHKDLSKSDLKAMIESVDTITEMVKHTQIDGGLNTRIGNLLPWNINNYRRSKLEEILEDLNNNDLHISSKKLSIYT